MVPEGSIPRSQWALAVLGTFLDLLDSVSGWKTNSLGDLGQVAPASFSALVFQSRKGNTTSRSGNLIAFSELTQMGDLLG